MENENVVTDSIIALLATNNAKLTKICKDPKITPADTIKKHVIISQRVFDKNKNKSFDYNLLFMYLLLADSVARARDYYMMHESNEQNKFLSEYADIGKLFMGHFFQQYSLYSLKDQFIIESTPQNTEQLAIVGLLYKRNATFSDSQHDRTVTLTLYTLALSEFAYSITYINEIPRGFIADIIELEFLDLVTQIIAELPMIDISQSNSGQMKLQCKYESLSEHDIDLFLKCFDTLTDELLLYLYHTSVRANNGNSARIAGYIFHAVVFTLEIGKKKITEENYDDAHKILIKSQTLNSFLKIDNLYMQIGKDQRINIDLHIAESIYGQARSLLLENTKTPITMDLLLSYIQNGSHPFLVNIFILFAGAKRETNEKLYLHLSTADKIENVFQEMHQLFKNEISNPAAVIKNIIRIEKKITKFIVNKGIDANKSDQYVLAEILFHLALQIYPIPKKFTDINDLTFTIASHANISYNLYRSRYRMLLNNLKEKNMNKEENKLTIQKISLEGLALYLSVLRLWILVEPNLPRDLLGKIEPQIESTKKQLQQFMNTHQDLAESKQKELDYFIKTANEISMTSPGQEMTIFDKMMLYKLNVIPLVQKFLISIYKHLLIHDQQESLNRLEIHTLVCSVHSPHSRNTVTAIQDSSAAIDAENQQVKRSTP